MHYAFLLHMTLTLGRIHCVTSKRHRKGTFVCDARSWDYCFMLVRFPFLSFTYLKLFLYTESVVRLLHLVRVLYPVCSPWSAVRSPQSAVHSPCFILTDILECPHKLRRSLAFTYLLNFIPHSPKHSSHEDRGNI